MWLRALLVGTIETQEIKKYLYFDTLSSFRAASCWVQTTNQEMHIQQELKLLSNIR